MGSLKDIHEIISGIFRRKKPDEYKTWQEITQASIAELIRENEKCKKENEELRKRITELETNVKALMKGKSRGMYE